MDEMWHGPAVCSTGNTGCQQLPSGQQQPLHLKQQSFKVYGSCILWEVQQLMMLTVTNDQAPTYFWELLVIVSGWSIIKVVLAIQSDSEQSHTGNIQDLVENQTCIREQHSWQVCTFANPPFPSLKYTATAFWCHYGMCYPKAHCMK